MSSHGYTGSSGSKTSKPNVPERPPDINTPLNATIRQEGDEPLAEADMDWQATMKVSESKEAARRWYFKTQRTEFAVLGSDKPLRPKAVQSGDIWQAKLQLENVPIGWYWLVFCVSLKDMDLGSVESITFDARTGDAEGQPYCMENLIKTKLSKEDIQEIPKEDFVRLRLHRQIKYLPQYSYFYPDIAIETTAGTEVPVSFDLHYVELGSADFRSSSKVKDHVLYGNDAPDRFIRVGASCTEPIGVRAFDFSDTGAYAATLYLTTGKAHIQIWNLRTPDKKKRTPGKPQPLTLPCAQTSFDVSEVISDPFSIVDCFFSVAISSSGSKVAICSNEERDHAVSCTLFKYNPTAPVDHDLSKPWPLKRATLEICSNLVGTFGEIAFRGIDARDPKEQDERFFKFDGFTLEVYNTYNKWERLFVLTTKIDRMARDCLAKAVFHSIRGRRLVYTGVSGLVSIWDFEAGKVVSNISVPEDDAVVKAILSHDGSMVAIAVKKSVHVYDVISRIRLGVFKEGQDKNNELDFGQAYFMTLNYAASTSPYGEPPNARSIVRLSDMSIVSTFMLYEEYSLQTPQQNGEPIFAFDQANTC
ncbi:hypothetical protein BGX28_005447 [Mortierella sp. GBA30]|nr:hypothetical protein BGX28_005447 [Mortierella sp. GBA30]